MTEFIDVVEHNPIVFVKQVSEAIANGYRVQNSNAGYPQFSPYGNTIRLFKAERPGATIIPAEFNGMVEHYDAMGFILFLQMVVDAGYVFKDNGKHFFDEKGLKSVEMQLASAKEVVVETKPAKKAPAKKALKAEPTLEEMEETNGTN